MRRARHTPFLSGGAPSGRWSRGWLYCRDLAYHSLLLATAAVFSGLGVLVCAVLGFDSLTRRP